jgi:hypothetical protein
MYKTTTSFLVILVSFMQAANTHAAPIAKNTGFFELKVYHYKDAAQEASIDSFLQYQYLPFLHSARLGNIGVFKAIANDTAVDKKMYVFIPFNSLKQWEDFSTKAAAPAVTGESGYVNAVYNNPAYIRMEQILLKAFPLMQPVAPSKLNGPKSERVYELRSYEGPTEKFFRNKVKMFNEGGEISLFQRLGFNAVFYGEVLFGSRMPNLMYMTSFDNMRSREDHWKAFGSDPEWKTLAAKTEYQHNVSHIDITFLRPVEYSEL